MTKSTRRVDGSALSKSDLPKTLLYYSHPAAMERGTQAIEIIICPCEGDGGCEYVIPTRNDNAPIAPPHDTSIITFTQTPCFNVLILLACALTSP
jgi:hypothetical protein